MARILLGVTGSVAAVKTPDILKTLGESGHDVKLVMTKAATYFFDPKPLREKVTLDADEWPGERYQRGDAVGHIELRKWAEVMLIAPLDANTLAKIAHGLCDNALTSVVRAWDFSKPLLLAPAMNTLMWEHPLTRPQLQTVQSFRPGNVHIIEPISKVLACGDEGVGAMAEVRDIIRQVNQVAAHPRG